MIYNIDDKISFSKRYADETIRQIISHDSGYLKDLFKKDYRLVFSDECFKEICRLTKGHKEDRKSGEIGVFSTLPLYATPYLFDFNSEEIISLHNQKLHKEILKR